ncbi:MAG TPA: hypothetical protein PKX91_05275 [Clostridia bacterium]|jgi:hypothetical protein|nr:hypothetical protein [Clostridia bacterium]
MKKRLVLLSIFLSILVLLLFPSCKPNDDLAPALRTDTLARPETNLEFWIAENVDDIDFSSYTRKNVYSKCPVKTYYGTGYTPTVDENGEHVEPEQCVIYEITSYPDYSNKEKHITYIYITDPKIELYGFSLNSSSADFEEIMEKEGWTTTEDSELQRTAKKGKYSITFSHTLITIRVEVRNEQGLKW